MCSISKELKTSKDCYYISLPYYDDTEHRLHDPNNNYNFSRKNNRYCNYKFDMYLHFMYIKNNDTNCYPQSKCILCLIPKPYNYYDIDIRKCFDCIDENTTNNNIENIKKIITHNNSKTKSEKIANFNIIKEKGYELYNFDTPVVKYELNGDNFNNYDLFAYIRSYYKHIIKKIYITLTYTLNKYNIPNEIIDIIMKKVKYNIFKYYINSIKINHIFDIQTEIISFKVFPLYEYGPDEQNELNKLFPLYFQI